jgi:hypothetical protein
VAYIETLTILKAAKAFVQRIPHPTAAPAPLFQRVEFYDTEELSKALQELVIAEQSVCLIIPRGDHYRNVKEGRSMLSERDTDFEFLLADRSFAKAGADAKFGGPANVGVVTMKEILVKAFAADCTLGGLPFVTMMPTTGAFISLKDSDRGPSREAWVQGATTPTGALRTDLNRIRQPAALI